jgi:hypothetical protein
MRDYLIEIWEIILNNKEVMSGIIGIQILLLIMIIVMLALDEDEPIMRQ